MFRNVCNQKRTIRNDDITIQKVNNEIIGFQYFFNILVAAYYTNTSVSGYYVNTTNIKVETQNSLY